jgi:hypothetical protein
LGLSIVANTAFIDQPGFYLLPGFPILAAITFASAAPEPETHAKALAWPGSRFHAPM